MFLGGNCRWVPCWVPRWVPRVSLVRITKAINLTNSNAVS